MLTYTSKLSGIQTLIEQLNAEGVRYCHWKSNFYLQEALAGEGDLDLLIDRQDTQKFEKVVAALGFKRAIDPLQIHQPAVWHFFGLDQETGAFIHLHVYYRIISGESILKNYRLPIESLLLTDLMRVDSVPIPSKSTELIIFVLRMTIKHGSLLEYLLLRRNGENLQNELNDLLTEESEAGCLALLSEWLPTIDVNLFQQCLDCLRQDSSFVRHFWLATRLRQQLQPLNRFSPLAEGAFRLKLFSQQVLRKVRRSGKSKQLASGGAVIAFVGPEATGKSTLVRETSNWLGSVFGAKSAHLGKPPTTWLTALPQLGVPFLRKVANDHRPSQIQSNGSSSDRPVSWLASIRAVLLAWDRYRLAIDLHHQAANGKLIICDRYPSTVIGAMDSARLPILDLSGKRHPGLAYLARLEQKLYRQIPPADIVIHVTVPVEVAVARNQERQKTEDEEYLRRRHAASIVPSFPKSRTVQLSSDQSLSQTIQTVRRMLWDLL